MPLYLYKALRKGESEPYEAKLEAKDRFKVYDVVRKDNAQILTIKEIKEHASLFEFNLLSFFLRIKENDKIMLTRNLGAMLKAGLALSRALSVLERQTKKPKLKEVLQGVSNSIQQGSSLSGAMEKYPKVFSNLVVSMVASGEEAGTLAESLLTISEQLDRVYSLKKKVRGAMIYPSVIVFVLGTVGTLMMIFIVPTLTETFKSMEVELPMSTRVVIFLSDFLVAHTLLALLSLVGLVAFFMAAMRTSYGKRTFETIFLHIPVLGTIMKETNSARTGRTLSSLLSSGVNMLTSIEITRNVLQNSYYKDVLLAAQTEVEKGQALAKVFIEAEKIYPPLVGELIAVGEETGSLPDMLHQIATFYENEVDQKTKNMSTIIEPFLMLIVGAAVGFFAVSMISPIYGITASIQ
ncbi:MAG: Type II secretion system protein [Parcubacteria group bacterium GW2011_GWA2_43_11]|nr:MAG: Type II secretion system protein [Parcubacteria group bacterium GW2011_GWC2_42_11]KKS85930.1 MAG: Type II secretion system protein [Parcubacteria group bacterium GW2011_GWA2_43_11]